jgi:hypothetical protein
MPTRRSAEVQQTAARCSSWQGGLRLTYCRRVSPLQGSTDSYSQVKLVDASFQLAIYSDAVAGLLSAEKMAYICPQ